MWQIRYAESAIRDDILTLDAAIKPRVKKAIEIKLTTDPIHFGKPLRHSLHNLRSLRVGDYRVLYHLDPDTSTVSVVSIAHGRIVYDYGFTRSA
jgi:mRNA interferase RelE/StbE